MWRRILPHSWPGWFGWFTGVAAAVGLLFLYAEAFDGWMLVALLPVVLVVGLGVGTFWYGFERFQIWLHSDEQAEQSEGADALSSRVLSAEALRAFDARLIPHEPPAPDGVESEGQTRPRNGNDDA